MGFKPSARSTLHGAWEILKENRKLCKFYNIFSQSPTVYY